MDIKLFEELVEIYFDLNDTEQKWLHANIRHILERFNEKFQKNININISLNNK